MDPRLLAENAECPPPASSWWALKPPLTLARCGSGKRPSGWHGGGGGTIGGEIVPQPPSEVFFNTARPKEHQISGIWKEVEHGGSTDMR